MNMDSNNSDPKPDWLTDCLLVLCSGPIGYLLYRGSKKERERIPKLLLTNDWLLMLFSGPIGSILYRGSKKERELIPRFLRFWLILSLAALVLMIILNYCHKWYVRAMG